MNPNKYKNIKFLPKIHDKRINLNQKFSALTPKGSKGKINLDTLNSSIESTDVVPIKINSSQKLQKLNKSPIKKSNKITDLSKSFTKFNTKNLSIIIEKEKEKDKEKDNYFPNKNNLNLTSNLNKTSVDNFNFQRISNDNNNNSSPKPNKIQTQKNSNIKRKKNLSKLIAPLDPKLYKVNMEDVVKKYEDIKNGNIRKISNNLNNNLNNNNNNNNFYNKNENENFSNNDNNNENNNWNINIPVKMLNTFNSGDLNFNEEKDISNNNNNNINWVNQNENQNPNNNINSFDNLNLFDNKINKNNKNNKSNINKITNGNISPNRNQDLKKSNSIKSLNDSNNNNNKNNIFQLQQNILNFPVGTNGNNINEPLEFSFKHSHQSLEFLNDSLSIDNNINNINNNFMKTEIANNNSNNNTISNINTIENIKKINRYNYDNYNYIKLSKINKKPITKKNSYNTNSNLNLYPDELFSVIESIEKGNISIRNKLKSRDNLLILNTNLDSFSYSYLNNSISNNKSNINLNKNKNHFFSNEEEMIFKKDITSINNLANKINNIDILIDQNVKSIKNNLKEKENQKEKDVDKEIDKDIEKNIDKESIYKKHNSQIEIISFDNKKEDDNINNNINDNYTLPLSSNLNLNSNSNTQKNCIYCLRILHKPIILTTCKHKICLECAREYISIIDYLKNYDFNLIKCPKCKKKSYISDKINFKDNIDISWNELADDEESNPNNKNTNANNKINLNKKSNFQICEICPSNKTFQDPAIFECLNCDIFICVNCRNRHLSQERHKFHKIIHLETNSINSKNERNLSKQNKNNILCPIHKEPNKLYCITEGIPICLVCSNYENTHEGHEIKSIKSIIENSERDLKFYLNENEEKMKYFDKQINDLFRIKEKLEKQKIDFEQKTEKIFEEIFNAVNEKKNNLLGKINKIFVEKLDKINNELKNLGNLCKRNEQLSSFTVFNDIEIVDKLKQSKLINKFFKNFERNNIIFYGDNDNNENNNEIKKEKFIDKQNFEEMGNENKNNYNLSINISDINYEKKEQFYSLKNSYFDFNPLHKIQKSLEKFDFVPVLEKEVFIIKNLFKENKSNIINQEIINSNFMSCMPKIKSGSLLYKISEDSADPLIFHEKCNDKGPTITLVKLEDGHIFGGFNPLSWINDYLYNITLESFLFSITDGKYRLPMKCPIKKDMKKYAIKQNKNEYSPGFGETDKADLFIAFKNLKNSYSNLGNVYKNPEGFKSDEFLAGRPNNWDINEIEVYAVELKSNKFE
jgi:hypothetical protein